MMKYILQVPAHLSIGGVEKVARDIGLYADPNLYEVHYIVFDEHEGEYERELLDHGCKVFHLKEPSLNYRHFLDELKRIMTETRYDVIQAHTMFNIGWIMKMAKQKKIPIRIAHAHSALDTGGGIKVKIYEAVMRHLILHNATDLVACSEQAGIRLFGGKAYRKRGNLILNGIAVESYRFNAEKRARIRKVLKIQDNFVIGHAGHLAAVKNQKFLLSLMPDILKCRPDAKLLLLGDGPDRKMLEDTVKKLHLQEHVILTGNVSNVPDYLSAMDVFAFPSYYEGMPLSIIEAQANGLPCILSKGVPQDVYLTDLIHPMQLENQMAWIKEICEAKRGYAEQYADVLENSGFDTQSAMKKIYGIYERIS